MSLISGIEGNRNSNNNSYALNNTYIVSNNNKYVNLASNERTKHVLYGDKTGGGHMWPGLNKKTSFPKSWNTDKIMNELSDISTDPSLKWNLNRIINGVKRYDVIGIRDNIKIKVITDGRDIITSFPIE